VGAPQTSVVSEITRLRASIDRAAAAADVLLAGHPSASAGDGPRSLLTERKELCRQLGALRDRVAVAESRNESPGALRAELATLLSFAGTLQADADDWRSALEQQIKELERQRTAAHKERESLAEELEELVRRRDTLQLTILHTAARVAQQYRGELRRTVPVFTLGEGLTICSVSVSCPRRGFRFAKQWLVTLTRSHDVLIRRE
jgi:hypothetical protein